MKRNWYVDAQSGVPLGVSIFSSFDPDKTRAGMNAGIYSGMTYLTGSRMDGMLQHLHTNNYIRLDS